MTKAKIKTNCKIVELYNDYELVAILLYDELKVEPKCYRHYFTIHLTIGDNISAVYPIKYEIV